MVLYKTILSFLAREVVEFRNYLNLMVHDFASKKIRLKKSRFRFENASNLVIAQAKHSLLSNSELHYQCLYKLESFFSNVISCHLCSKKNRQRF